MSMDCCKLSALFARHHPILSPTSFIVCGAKGLRAQLPASSASSECSVVMSATRTILFVFTEIASLTYSGLFRLALFCTESVGVSV